MSGRFGVRARLSGMMGGVYAVQGAFWPLLAVHLRDLGIAGRARGWIFATLAIASLLTPLGVGQLADRLMPAQRLMAWIYALGALPLAVLALGWVTTTAPLFGVFLGYWLLTAPALGLCSAIAFRNLERPGEQFGGVRLWGTVGWMVIGWVVSGVIAVRSSDGVGVPEAFAVASVLSMLMAVYCLTLPHTPPLGGSKASSSRSPLDLREVRELVRQPSVAIFLALAFGVSLTTPYVYQVVPAHLAERQLPRRWIAAAMSLGQVLEVAALAVLPRIIGRFRYKGTLALGVLAWMAYYGVLSLRLPLPLGLIGLPIQGLAIALFHIAGPMFLDRQAPPSLRATAQGLYVTLSTGLGMLVGSVLAGEVVERAGKASAGVFLAPFSIDAALLVVLLLAFRPDSKPQRRPEVA
jgi:MFS family permease